MKHCLRSIRSADAIPWLKLFQASVTEWPGVRPELIDINLNHNNELHHMQFMNNTLHGIGQYYTTSRDLPIASKAAHVSVVASVPGYELTGYSTEQISFSRLMI